VSNVSPLRRAEETPPKSELLLGFVIAVSICVLCLAGAWKFGELFVDAIKAAHHIRIVWVP
jgi:hypothetical protein